MNVPQVLRENNWSRKSNGVKPTSDGAEKKGAAQRSPDDGPFCWQTKAARRRIRDHFDCTGNVCSALGVYDALTEIASDKQSAVFTTTHAHIAKYSGVSPSTVKRIIAGFDELRLVKIQDSSVGKFRAPSIYTLLSLGHHDLSLGNYELTLGHRPKNGPWPIYEESLEQSPEKSPEKRQTRQSVDWRSGAQKEKLELIDSYNRICLPHRWRAVNKFTKVLDKALDYFLDSFLPGAPTERDLRETFEEAVRMRNEGDAEYNAPKGNTLIRILYRD